MSVYESKATLRWNLTFCCMNTNLLTVLQFGRVRCDVTSENSRQMYESTPLCLVNNNVLGLGKYCEFDKKLIDYVSLIHSSARWAKVVLPLHFYSRNPITQKKSKNSVGSSNGHIGDQGQAKLQNSPTNRLRAATCFCSLFPIQSDWNAPCNDSVILCDRWLGPSPLRLNAWRTLAPDWSFDFPRFRVFFPFAPFVVLSAPLVGALSSEGTSGSGASVSVSASFRAFGWLRRGVWASRLVSIS